MRNVCQTFQGIISSMENLQPDRYMWIGMPERWTSLEEKCSHWLKDLQERGFYIPKLTKPLRNGKHIVDFAKDRLSQSDQFLGIDNIVLISNTLDSPPDNAISGHEVLSLEKGSLKSHLSHAFTFLPQKSLVIIDSEHLKESVSQAIQHETKQRPLAMWNHTEPHDDNVQDWLNNEKRTETLITTYEYIAGFEWPAILIISDESISPKSFLNMILRGMSKVVFIKLDESEGLEGTAGNSAPQSPLPRTKALVIGLLLFLLLAIIGLFLYFTLPSPSASMIFIALGKTEM